MVALKDKEGYTTFSRAFHLLLEQLRLINHEPTTDELNVIVKNAIQNVDLVNLCIVPYSLDSANPFYWKSCLERCSNAMKHPSVRRSQPDLLTAVDKPSIGRKVDPDLRGMSTKLDKLTVAMANFTPSS